MNVVSTMRYSRASYMTLRSAVLTRASTPIPSSQRLYLAMLRIRLFEDAVLRLFMANEVEGTTHLCQGQEAVCGRGMRRRSRPGDTVAATYRGHGAALALGVDATRLMAELLGRETGTNGGRGGSMNVTDLERGLIGCFGIVGGSIAAATGAALAAQLTRDGSVAVAFFGDGAVNQAYFHECLNFAAVRRLPVVYVLREQPLRRVDADGRRDRGRATSPVARSGVRHPRREGRRQRRARRACSRRTRRRARSRAATARRCSSASTYRHKGHSKVDPGAYRPPEEVEEWLARDPIPRLAAQLDDDAVEQRARCSRGRARAGTRRGARRRRSRRRDARDRDEGAPHEGGHLPRGGPRRPRRGARARRAGGSARRGRLARRRLQRDARPAVAIRRGSSDRHADLRARVHRRGVRGRGAGPPSGRRDHVRRLPRACRRHSRQPGVEVLVPDQRAGERAARRRKRGRGRGAARCVPLADPDVAVHGRAGPDARRARNAPPTRRVCSSLRSATRTRLSCSSTSFSTGARARSPTATMRSSRSVVPRCARAGDDVTIVAAMRAVEIALEAAEVLAADGVERGGDRPADAAPARRGHDRRSVGERGGSSSSRKGPPTGGYAAEVVATAVELVGPVRGAARDDAGSADPIRRDARGRRAPVGRAVVAAPGVDRRCVRLSELSAARCPPSWTSIPHRGTFARIVTRPTCRLRDAPRAANEATEAVRRRTRRKA